MTPCSATAAHFNPRSPHGERQRTPFHPHPPSYFNPRSPHGERRGGGGQDGAEKGISIHAPRTGSDVARAVHGDDRLGISIHAPRTGSDIVGTMLSGTTSVFQSTLPARGATAFRSTSPPQSAEFQSTLPARGATSCRTPAARSSRDFNPRSPHGERRLGANLQQPHIAISIHAPRTGSDVGKDRRLRGVPYFNPRSPHGERLDALDKRIRVNLFQSTLPARGATTISLLFCACTTISIHAPRTGSDPRLHSTATKSRHFNPRSPHGERPARHRGHRAEQDISIHAPRTGSDVGGFEVIKWEAQFQSTLPARGATGQTQTVEADAPYFNPRSPHGERR